MEISGTGVSEERIAALEKKVRDMEALVNGLIAEMLDIKTVTMKVSKQMGEQGGRQVSGQQYGEQDAAIPVSADSGASGTIAPDEGTRTVIRPRSESRPEAPAEPDMVRIMQADGTMKMEPRHGDSRTTDPSKSNEQMKRSTTLRSKRTR